MTSPPLLVDKSALEQRRHSETARALLTEHAAEDGLATCEITALEILYSARNRDHYAALHAALRQQRWLSVDAASTARALEVQRMLADRGQHRMSIADLLIAATAEVHGATVLHHDRDFDRIAAVTGQSTRWIVPAGSGFGGDR